MKCKKKLNFIELSGSNTTTPDGKDFIIGDDNIETPAYLKSISNSKHNSV